ncbi:MAG: uroporphyrinogen decarboxylase, partial [Trebonia sp.]
MNQPLTNSPFLRACRGEPVPYTPVWFMRQAGRSLPEYKKVRAGTAMLESCTRPELVTEITLQPMRRYDVDAAILFSDIVVPLKAVGVDVEIKPGVGPVVGSPIRALSDLDQLRDLTPDDVPYITESVKALTGELGGKPLIGFAGGPFTLASYLIEGGKSANFSKTKKLMFGAPDDFRVLMGKLAGVVRRYLVAQIEAGAQAVQLFDSWVGDLAPADYVEHVQPHVKHVLDGVAGMGVPVLHFGVGTATLLEAMRDAGGTVLGVYWCTPLDDAWRRVGYDRAVQGNMDPCALLATRDVAVKHAQRVLDAAAGRAGHVFNLG